jgi:hypothetical protein
MADNFKELLDEQKKTNQLLVKSMKDPDLGSSIKQNLGEILNASRLAGSSEKFQKKEGITEVDEAQQKTTEIIAKSSVLQLEKSQGSIFELVKINDSLITLGEQLTGMSKTNSVGAVVTKLQAMFNTGIGKLSAAQQEEDEDNKKKKIKKQTDALEKVAKNTGKDGFFGKFVNDLGKNILGDAMTIGKRLFQLAGLFGLYKILTDKNMLSVAKALDEALPGLKVLGGYLKSIATAVGGFVGKQLETLGDPDATSREKAFAGGALLVSGLIALYSKTIGLHLAKLGLPLLLGFSKLTVAAFFSPIGLFAAAVLGAYFVKDEAIKRAKEIIEKEGAQDSAMAKMRIYTSTFLGEMAGGVNLFLADIMEMFNEERAEEMRKVDYSVIINESLKGIGQFIAEVFDNIRQFFVGSTDKDIKKDIEKQREIVKKKQDRVDKIIAGKDDVIPFAPGTLPFEMRVRSLENSLTELNELEGKLKQLNEAGDGSKLVKNLFGGGYRIVGPGEPANNSFSFGMYKGGRASAGQSIMVGEAGPELMIPRTDAQIYSAKRTEEMIMSALARGMSGGGESSSPTIITDNSIRSNTSNMISSPSMITSNDSLMNSITNSV